MKADLATLIDKVRALEGPDQSVDADILEATGGCAHKETEYYCIEDGNDIDSGFTCKRCGKDTYGERIPLYTKSVDAALALVEKVLPGSFYLASKGRLRADEPLYAAQLLFGSEEILGEAEHNASLAIALVLATLLALLDKGEDRG